MWTARFIFSNTCVSARMLLSSTCYAYQKISYVFIQDYCMWSVCIMRDYLVRMPHISVFRHWFLRRYSNRFLRRYSNCMQANCGVKGNQVLSSFATSVNHTNVQPIGEYTSYIVYKHTAIMA